MQHISQVINAKALEDYINRVAICIFDGGLSESEAVLIAKKEVIKYYGDEVLQEIGNYIKAKKQKQQD